MLFGDGATIESLGAAYRQAMFCKHMTVVLDKTTFAHKPKFNQSNQYNGSQSRSTADDLTVLHGILTSKLTSNRNRIFMY